MIRRAAAAGVLGCVTVALLLLAPLDAAAGGSDQPATDGPGADPSVAVVIEPLPAATTGGAGVATAGNEEHSSGGGDPAVESWLGDGVQLDLATDRSFAARGLDAAGDRIGRWGQDGFEITLMDDRGTVPVRVADDGTLRLPGPVTLRRVPGAAPLEPRLELRGSFVYFADAARFTECVTGRGYDVAMQGDYLALERAYSATRREPAEPVIATLIGRLGRAPAMEGGGTRPTLFVERFDQLWPRETCGTPFAPAELTETYWAITRLEGEPVTEAMFQAEPHLVFRAEGSRFAGSGGCNRLAGGWQLDGSRLTLAPGPMTMMACERGMDTERRLVAIMRRITGYTVHGSHLELLDEAGAVLVRCEQRLMP